MPEPLTIQGFYATRILFRRAIRAALILTAVVGGFALACFLMLAVAIDVLLISWGLR